MSANPDYIARLQSLEPIPTAQVLELLGFKRNRLGCYTHNWERLEVVAPEWFGGYHVLCTWWTANRRTLGIPEFKIPGKIAPACLLAILYQECGGAFQRGALPLEFQIGKARYELQSKIQSIIPPPPRSGLIENSCAFVSRIWTKVRIGRMRIIPSAYAQQTTNSVSKESPRQCFVRFEANG
jgi:hypothetical protein